MITTLPEEVGLDSRRLGYIRPALQALIDASLAPGFHVALMRRGKLVFQDCLGWQDVEAGVPLVGDTIFRIYSMTKPVAATAVMMLYEEGKLALNEPVAKYIPAVKNLNVWGGEGKPLEPLQRDITILDLTLHTAGFGYGIFEDSPVEDLYRAAGLFHYDKLYSSLPLAEFVDRVLDLPLAHQPGQRWRYSVSMDIIGRLVEIIAGHPFDVFLKERIFDPLGMVDTAFFVPPEKIGRLATMYAPGSSGTIVPVDQPDNSPFTNPQIMPSGGAGLLSTTQDYLRYQQMMLNGGELEGARILSPRTVKKMASNHLPPSMLPFDLGGGVMLGQGFGPGFAVVTDGPLAGQECSEGTFFWGGAATTNMFIDPREQMVGVCMTQVLFSPNPLFDYARQLMYSAITDQT
jgi:CubicO group peptidase (beta-lactamase class C family)